MHTPVLPIHVDYARAGISADGSPSLHAYLLDSWRDRAEQGPRPALIICPGGAYAFTANREAEPVAAQFCARGYHVFVLRYTTTPMPFPGALLELSAAVAMVRERAAEWNVDPDRLFVCGFSAGGHLAGSLGMFWNRDFVTAPLGLEMGANRPTGLLLSYPVITSGSFAHHESIHNLLLDRYEEQRELVSLEKQVTAETPPVFLWHTVEDPVVPVENSLMLANALRAAGVSFELHLYTHGGHGLALANRLTERVQPACETWVELAAQWMETM